jgi:hypothetical protein
MPKNYTRFTNLEVTGEFKTGAAAGITAVPTVGSSYSQTEVNKIVTAVNALIKALGGTT